jgi:pimeloyl-ACP methyl ester carboxylesterase
MRIVKCSAIALCIMIIAAVGFLYLAPAKALGLAYGAERWRAGLVKKEITLPGGLRYVYLEGGKGEPLMLLHGFGADKENFTRVARYLTPHYHVIIPDHIGFGESAHPADADYASTVQVERLRALARALGIKELHLGGSSMGGQFSLFYAAMYPGEVKSLWLLDPGGVWSAKESDVRKIVRETGRNPLMAKTEDEFAQLFKFAMSDPPFIPRPLLNVMAQDRIKNFSLEERIFKQASIDSVEDRIRGSKVPALIVWGDKDRAINVAAAEILHKLMPKSKVIIMKGIGHLPMVERPRESAEDYLKFRSSL